MNELSDFVTNNPTAAILLGLYLIITFSDAKGRSKFLDNSFNLLTNPSVAEKYPEHLWEKMEKNFEDGLGNPISRGLSTTIQSLSNIVIQQQWKLIGQFLLFIFLMLFFLADAIVLVSVAEVVGIPLENLPDSIRSILGQYGIAITVGSFFSLVAAGLVVFDTFGQSEFTDISQYTGGKRRIVQIGAVLVLLLSLFVGIFLGFVPLGVTLDLPSWVNIVADICRDVIVRANVLIATLIILEEGLKGLFRSTGIFIITSLIVVLAVLFVIYTLFYGLLRLGIDLFVRILLWLFYLISFLVFSPFDRTIKAPADFVKLIINLFGKEKTP